MYTAVRFRSGEHRIVIYPERAELVRAWADAVEGRSDDRVAVLTVSRTDLRGHPERRERVDLTAIESLFDDGEG